jgi:hypothetical protein
MLTRCINIKTIIRNYKTSKVLGCILASLLLSSFIFSGLFNLPFPTPVGLVSAVRDHSHSSDRPTYVTPSPSASHAVSPRLLSNQPPIANAGIPQTVNAGSTVTLDGSRSIDPERDKLSYSWTQIAGPSVKLSNNKTANPTFIVPGDIRIGKTAVTLAFQLIVNDGKVDSAPATVNVSVEPSQTFASPTTITPLPTTRAMPHPSQTLTTGPPPQSNPAPMAKDQPDVKTNKTTTVGITLQATDPDPNAKLQAQILSQPQHGKLGDVDQATGKVTYTPNPDYTGDDSFTFKVNDGKADSNTATVTINVIEGLLQQPPKAIANINQQIVKPGVPVTLDASNTKSTNSNPIKYTWKQIAGPIVKFLNNNSVYTSKIQFVLPHSEVANFAPKTTTSQLNNTQLKFELTATDQKTGLASTAYTTANTAAAANPIADAGQSQTLTEGQKVTLNGSASTDSFGKTQSQSASLAYEWKQIGGTSQVTFDPGTENTINPQFTAPTPAGGASSEKLTFSLVIKDNLNGSVSINPASVDIIVNAKTAPLKIPKAISSIDKTTAKTGEIVTLSSDGSTDSAGSTNIDYTWTQNSTGGTTIPNFDIHAPNPSFTVPSIAGGAASDHLTFQLTVNDKGNSSLKSQPSNPVTVTVVESGGGSGPSGNSSNNTSPGGGIITGGPSGNSSNNTTTSVSQGNNTTRSNCAPGKIYLPTGECLNTSEFKEWASQKDEIGESSLWQWELHQNSTIGTLLDAPRAFLK